MASHFVLPPSLLSSTGHGIQPFFTHAYHLFVTPFFNAQSPHADEIHNTNKNKKQHGCHNPKRQHVSPKELRE
ncbi:hypothetical protein BDN72DRAFT_835995 [Pluteus cervinus]|uniref:Uncharacterized protein n=1 Tax=Pluteus cervinus TaxID=181527 RepID=A0ACD3B4E7_9AGAR|nr:hypothetical protein BDN72DRAFT_835995 [Pluteus cervinus]